MQHKNKGMVIMDKKAMLKTAEALIAIVISLVFVVLVFSRAPLGGPMEKKLDVLHQLQGDHGFRNCAAAGDTGCIRDYVNESIPLVYDFYVDISSQPSSRPSGLPDTGIYLESLSIAGNITDYNPNVIRLYYWYKIQ